VLVKYIVKLVNLIGRNAVKAPSIKAPDSGAVVVDLVGIGLTRSKPEPKEVKYVKLVVVPVPPTSKVT
jgi:hypothetical protein